MNDLTYIDIETAPNLDLIASVGEFKFSEFMRRKKLEKPEFACLYPTYGKVVCVSLKGPDDSEVISFFGEDEAAILTNLKDHLEHNAVLCGHNIKGFDIPFLAFRYLAQRMNVPNALCVAGKKPWEINHVDTMELLKFGGRDSTGLGDACDSLGIPSPKELGGGAIVHELAAEGKWQAIADYCEDDVRAVIRIHKILERFGA